MEYHDYREINQRANFQLRNIQFSMPCYMQNTFQTKFSLQDSVYHFCNVKLYLLLQLLLSKPLQTFPFGGKKNKRKSRLTKSRRDKTILFTKSGANRLEQLISIGCSKFGGVVAIEGPGLSIGLLAARRLYTGVVGGCTRGSFEQGDG